MKELPILFSAPMVRALLDGSKTQTRRVVKKQPPSHADICICKNAMCGGSRKWHLPCPYGQPGDRLWVKETHRAIWSKANDEPHLQYRADGAFREPTSAIEHNRFANILDDAFGDIIENKDRKWRPSIFTFRWASRVTLEITGIRCERLQEISEEDACAEGIPRRNPLKYPSELYAALWESINGPGSWDANPWVWVVEFKVLTSDLDTIENAVQERHERRLEMAELDREAKRDRLAEQRDLERDSQP